MSNINSFSRLLSIGTICLFIGGTIAAKTVFLVDNDLETKSKLNAANWRLDANSARKYTEDLQKFSRPYLDSPGEKLRQRFSQFSPQSSWCESAREISLVLAEANLLNWAPQGGNVPESWCIQPKVKK
jgi:hypothetical protein